MFYLVSKHWFRDLVKFECCHLGELFGWADLKYSSLETWCKLCVVTLLGLLVDCFKTLVSRLGVLGVLGMFGGLF